MAKKKQKSTAPSGLGVTRSRSKITFKWKNHNYEKQQLEWGVKCNGEKFAYSEKYNVPKSACTATAKPGIKVSDYYPETNDQIEFIQFNIRGTTKDTDNINYTESDWAKSPGVLKIEPPLEPTSVAVAVVSAYAVDFTVQIEGHKNEKGHWGTKVQYQTCLIFDYDYKPTEDDWNQGENGSWTIYDSVRDQDTTEFTYHANDTDYAEEIVASEMAVRWFRAREVGPGGDSPWFPAAFSYSDAPEVSGIEATVTEVGLNRYSCNVSFNSVYSLGVPIDYATIEYSIANVTKDLEPTGESWTTAEIGGGNTIAPEIYDPSKADKVTGDRLGSVLDEDPQYGKSLFANAEFTIQGTVADDQLIFVRVNTVHNGKTIPSDPVIARDIEGKIPNATSALAKPTTVTLTDGVGNLMLVEVENACSITGAFLTVDIVTMVKSQVITETSSWRQIIKDIEVPVYKTIGIIALNGTGTVSKSIEFPQEYVGEEAEPYSIGVRAVVGSYDEPSRMGTQPNQYNIYTVNPVLSSETVSVGALPKTPSKPKTDNLSDGNVRVSWDWTWDAALSAEIAWSDYELAMESNETPSSFVVANTKTSSVVIRNLEAGKRWYFWVRLLNDKTVTAWSEASPIDLTSAPNDPELSVSKPYYISGESVYVSWSYVSTDSTEQAFAEIAQIIDPGDNIIETKTGNGEETVFEVGGSVDSVVSVKVDGAATSAYTRSGKKFTFTTAPGIGKSVQITYISTEEYYNQVAKVPNLEQPEKTDQFTSFIPIGWETGKNYKLSAKVTSDSGKTSNWSKPVTIAVPPEVVCHIDEHSLVPSMNPDMLSLRLTQLPLTVKVSGGTEPSMVTRLDIERAGNYFVDRPDGGTYGGYSGEVVYSKLLTASGDFVVNQEDINGYLDDTAYYALIATVEDTYGQTNKEQARVDFVVDWSHQAVMPNIEMRVDYDRIVAFIKILDPVDDHGRPISGYPGEGDVCDIYRHSVDGYELVYAGAEFGKTYVDPFPTLGDHGGHRVVYRTKNGDCSTAGGFAWLDIYPADGDYFESDSNLINFGNESIEATYNVDLSSSWKKDFQKTRYLGGSIEGDWNAGVERTGSINTTVLTQDILDIETYHKLAEYEGYCRVRSTDGSNYVADVQVSENISQQPYYGIDGAEWTKLASYSINIEKVDSPTRTLLALGGEGAEGYTEYDWEQAIGINVNRVDYAEVGIAYVEE